MYVNNTTKNEIGTVSFEGYNFTVLPGVNAVTDGFGKLLTETLYKIETAPGEAHTGAQREQCELRVNWPTLRYAQAIMADESIAAMNAHPIRDY